MMTKRYVRDEVLTKKMSESLKHLGFRYVKSKSSIIRSYKGGFDRIIISVTDYNPVFWPFMTLMSRIDKVENIVNLFMEDVMNKDFMNITPTSITTLKDLSGIEYFKVQTEEELNHVSQFFISLIAEKGINYFDQHHDIVFVNNERKYQILEDSYLGRYRTRGDIMISLVLMKLCNDPDLEVLYPKYLEYYVPISGQEITGRKAIVDLFEYLKKM